MRIIHGCMFTAMLGQLYVLHMLNSGRTQAPNSDPVIPYVIALVAVVDLGIILLLRRFVLEKALTALKQNFTDASAILKWRTAMILTSAGVYSCFLFGWILALLGTTHTWTYRTLWGVALVGFIVFTPRLPIDEMTMTQQNAPPPGP